MEAYDVVIIGGGPAGMTAAIYAARQGLSTLVLEKAMCGGLMLQTEKIENYPGFTSVSGSDLALRMKSQAISNGVKVQEMKEVVRISDVVQTRDEQYKYKYLVLAMGTAPRKLGVEGESKFLGSGVSYCAVCDGFFFKNKVVAVVGGGNSALTEAIYLSKIARKVLIVYHGQKFKAEQSLITKIRSTSNIECVMGAEVRAIKGDDHVERLKLDDQELAVDGVFIAIGHVPNTSILRGFVDLDKRGYVVVDQNMRTSKSNVFACGDITNHPIKQITTACAHGAIAALNMG